MKGTLMSIQYKFAYAVVLTICLSACAFAQQAGLSPIPSVVTVSAASYDSTVIARGSIVAAFGDKIAGGTDTNSVSIVLLDSKGGAITVGTYFAITPNQVNFLVPDRLAIGGGQVLAFNNVAGQRVDGTLTLADVAPGIFTANSTGRDVPSAYVIRAKANGAQAIEPVAKLNAAASKFVTAPVSPAADGEDLYLVLYGTGWRNRTALENASVTVGGVKAEIKYIGAQGDFAGLDQMNILLPKGLPVGIDTVNVVVDGKQANQVVIELGQTTSTTN